MKGSVVQRGHEAVAFLLQDHYRKPRQPELVDKPSYVWQIVASLKPLALNASVATLNTVVTIAATAAAR